MKGNQLRCSTFIKIFQITLIVLLRANINTYTFVTLHNRTWRLYFCLLFFNIFFKKSKLSRGDGGLNHICGKSRGEGGGVNVFLKKWKIWGGGGLLSELPSVVGVWIFSGTTQYMYCSYSAMTSRILTVLWAFKIKINESCNDTNLAMASV